MNRKKLVKDISDYNGNKIELAEFVIEVIEAIVEDQELNRNEKKALDDAIDLIYPKINDMERWCKWN
ncbi:hypothetical protein Psfp_03884 [Pelotomaculum sp. FP]|uniref:hypothetical protein n=1 Tax=Pelotomaculum sp. FP TaxID=261474 RepID=UPI0010669C94|nr:hypothetical protein [Pelotomaculum sp. FP]TEB11755.1 hypothetical protein Psfp_03884 [Pelotomaculum sp. FP]